MSDPDPDPDLKIWVGSGSGSGSYSISRIVEEYIYTYAVFFQVKNNLFPKKIKKANVQVNPGNFKKVSVKKTAPDENCTQKNFERLMVTFQRKLILCL